MKRYRKDKTGLDAKRIPNDMEIAWSAGIFEGEGSCVQNGHNKNSFSIVVTQKDPELLYRLQEFFGGNIRLYGAGRQNRFQIFQWTVCGDRGRRFIASIYNFMTARRKGQIDSTSAREFLDYAGTVPESGISEFVGKRLTAYVADHRQAAKQANKRQRKEYYERRKAIDPTFMQTRAARTESWRKRKAAEKFSNVVAIA